MAVEERVVWGFRCERCGNRWIPRVMLSEPPEPYPEDALPTVCPKCKNTRWNKRRHDQSKSDDSDTTGSR